MIKITIEDTENRGEPLVLTGEFGFAVARTNVDEEKGVHTGSVAMGDIDLFNMPRDIAAMGKALLEAREMTGTSREDLSARTRMCVDTIKKYESEDANPSLKKIFRIADALGCGFGWDKNSFFFYPWLKTKDRADTFAEELKKVREDKGYSQRALAEKSGIKVATITGYETGKTCPSLKSMIKIAQTLNCTFGWDRSSIWFSKIKKKKTKKPVEPNYYSFDFY